MRAGKNRHNQQAAVATASLPNTKATYRMSVYSLDHGSAITPLPPPQAAAYFEPRIELEIIPEKRDPGKPAKRVRYAARLADRILCVSEQPFVDAARVLVAEGGDPEATLAMRHKESGTIALTARLGAAAKLTVKEGACGPRFAAYAPYQGPTPVEDYSHFEERPEPPKPRPAQAPVAPDANTSEARPVRVFTPMEPQPAPAGTPAGPQGRWKEETDRVTRGAALVVVDDEGGRVTWKPPKVSGWLKFRYAVGKRAGWPCEACGRVSGTLQIDHIKPRSKYLNGDLVPENLQMLCWECNIGKGNWDETAWRTA